MTLEKNELAVANERLTPPPPLGELVESILGELKATHGCLNDLSNYMFGDKPISIEGKDADTMLERLGLANELAIGIREAVASLCERTVE